MNKEQKYILIEADYNDGDYVHRLSEITDEQIEIIKPVIAAISNNDCDYRTGEMEDKPDSIIKDYGHIEGFDLFDSFVPYGEYGIHTIESIEIITKHDRLL